MDVCYQDAVWCRWRGEYPLLRCPLPCHHNPVITVRSDSKHASHNAGFPGRKHFCMTLYVCGWLAVCIFPALFTIVDGLGIQQTGEFEEAPSQESDICKNVERWLLPSLSALMQVIMAPPFLFSF
ncbi:hypothetical protein BO71DRAFT_401833 [Aspergillus ellipticus CBS 707.79]|uniref:Uncharacterized protein n=1 Tax=Aspergillus ellipticus CBS 707.79 TaxID=1448320 RepID=A0A319EIV0_9EURO|nr:hypothetical protein BO71DRAFT_401833 [Aspergillus ellipticus CBS 707.79]